MSDPKRHMSLWALFALQAFCAAFFLGDAVFDALGLEATTGVRDTDAFEYLVAAALVLGLVFTWRELRRLIARQQRMEAQLRIASGAFAELLEEHFDSWSLTPSERDVALLSIKGLSIAEIAAVRETRAGTVKAQSAAVYRKAGVSGRPQLLSLFIEELMSDPLTARAP